jgi:transcriptional regulator with XRE-family HTH domain
MSSHYAGQDGMTIDGGTQSFGLTLRRCRLQQGLSLRTVAKRIGLSAHSGVAEYESGRRIPPDDLMGAYEQALCVPAGYLRSLREQALKERADRLTTDSPALPEPAPRYNTVLIDQLRITRIVTTTVVAASAALVAVGLIHAVRAAPRMAPDDKQISYLLIVGQGRGFD